MADYVRAGKDREKKWAWIGLHMRQLLTGFGEYVHARHSSSNSTRMPTSAPHGVPKLTGGRSGCPGEQR